ncbi:response regulator transcription factor [Winogradskyella sp. PE311]|uniref:response regulator transcription factor n=1 Tax=Winogradskyella sp. PE311 TaxID=3366943 RepID=UPI0039803902
MRKCFLISIFYILNVNVSLSQSKGFITGEIDLSEQWSPNIYLSEISSFDNIYKMSNSMIISESKIDSAGRFKFDLKNLSTQDVFYRLHVSKKNAPKASLIIGGKDENHFFIVANNSSKIDITIDSKSGVFNKIDFSDTNNRTIQYIDAVLKNIDSIDFGKTQIKRSFIVKAAEEKLRFIADTTSHPLVSLHALYKSNFKNNVIDHKEYYYNYINKWKNENTSYFEKFKSELSLEKFTNKSYFVFYLIGSFLLGLIIRSYFYYLKRDKGNDLIKLLSIQERKVYQLLKEGKSNKEISEKLNIGISTVKSHVSSIYSKLNVKSRKEIINIY